MGAFLLHDSGGESAKPYGGQAFELAEDRAQPLRLKGL